MTNAVIAEHMNELERLQGELRDKRERHLPVRPTISKIRQLQTLIMKLTYPKPKTVYRVPAETRRM